MTTARSATRSRSTTAQPALLVLCVASMLACGCRQPAERLSTDPARPIRIVVPFAAGGGTDLFARIMEEAIERNRLLPQPLLITNVDGAGGTIGSRRVKNAKPDGYTVLLLHDAIVTARYAGKAPYGPEAFVPVAATGELGLVL
ncbi:MAG: hypothetical protein IH989_07960, partial [Planctomycetes bacterium]|nr:hypothetical protein [Planctomycetota bacterium]